jgi:hypothetical protein
MNRAALFGVCVLSAAMAAACGGQDRNDEAAIAEQKPEVSGRGDDAPRLITATGCLTASGDQFVLTELEPGAAGPQVRQDQGGANPAAGAQPTTESYQLVGDEDRLKGLVGRQVRVTGAAEPPKVAEVRETTPPTQPGNATGTAGTPEPAKPGEPQVSATTETRLEVTQLRVETVSDTGQPCATPVQGQPR